MQRYFSSMTDNKGLRNIDHSPAGPSEKLTGGESSKSENLGDKNVVISSTTIDKKLLINLQQLRIGTVLHQSRYSVVYQGIYKSQPVAIKVIQPETDSNVSPVRKEKFEREITLLSRVKHDNIVKFIGASTEPTLILVMELMKGDTLQKYLRSIRPQRLDLKLSLSFALGISQAMEYLHANGIIHRDLKPSNLLLTEDKTKIKLADFGLAREEVETEMTAEVGTYGWMAPEMINLDPTNYGVKKHYNHKVDVYSFSMVLWELLTNNTPFMGKNDVLPSYDATHEKVRPSTDDIPKEIEPLITSCWSEDPADRPEFEKISEILANNLGNEYTPEATYPNDSQRQPVNADIPGTSGGTHEEAESNKKKKKKRTKSKQLLCCFISGHDNMTID